MFKELVDDDFIPIRETEDQVLDPLLDEIDRIADKEIRSFTRAILLSAPDWFWTAPSSLEFDLILDDEANNGGLLRSIKRTVKVFDLLAKTANLNTLEYDKGMAAVLLGQLDKYSEYVDDDGNDDIEYNYWGPMVTSTRIDKVVKMSSIWAKDGLSNTAGIKHDDMEDIKRLIRVQDGKWTPIPEIRPRSTLELVYHQSVYVASSLRHLTEGPDGEFPI